MKDRVLAILNQRLAKIDENITSHKESLGVGLKMPYEFKKDGIEVLESKIASFEREKVDCLNCIEWVKGL